MLLYLLAVVVLIILILTFLGVKRDLMHPCVILCASYFLCICAAIYNLDYWQVEYHANTVILVTSALLCISIPSILISRCFPKRTYSLDILEKEANSYEINIDGIVFVVLFFICVITTAWYGYVAIQEGGVGTITEILVNFRMASSYGQDESFSMPFLLNQLIKLSKVVTYFMLLVFINNYIACKNRDYKYLLFVVLYLVQSLISGNRQNILDIILNCIIASYILVRRFKSWDIKNTGKYVKIIVEAFCALLVFFVLAGNFLGRSTIDKGPLRSITTYIGGAVALLELFMQEPGTTSAIWGEETFSSLYKSFSDVGSSIRHLEFRSSNGIVIGNIYGALRKYYFDFGFGGTILLCILFGIIFSVLYEFWIKSEKISRPLSLRLCIYALIIHCAFYFPLDDLFYSGVLSINYLTQVILMCVIYYFTIKRKIIFKIRQ